MMARTVQPRLRAEVGGVTQLPAVAAKDSPASKFLRFYTLCSKKNMRGVCDGRTPARL